MSDEKTQQPNLDSLKEKAKKYERISQRIPKVPKKKRFFSQSEAQDKATKVFTTLNKGAYYIPNYFEKVLNKHTKKLRSTGVVRPDDRRSTLEVIIALSDKAEGFLKFSVIKQCILAFYSGVYVCAGVMLSVYLSTGMPYFGIARLLTAIGLCCGLIMSSLTGSALFTEQNVILPVNYVKFRRHLFKTIRFWLISFVFNSVGCAFMGLMFNAGLAVRSQEVQAQLGKILEFKLQHMDYGRIGWWGILLSGTGVILANMSRDVPGKVIAMLVAVISFVATGVDHCAANIGFFSIGIVHEYLFSEPLHVKNLSLSNAILWNIVPTAIGNIIGSFVFVSATYSFLFSSKHVVSKLAKQNGEAPAKPKKNNLQNDSTSTLGGQTPNTFGNMFKSPMPAKSRIVSRVVSRVGSRQNSRPVSRDFSKSVSKFSNNTFNKAQDLNSAPSSSKSNERVTPSSRSVDHSSKPSSPRNFSLQSPNVLNQSVKNMHFGSLDTYLVPNPSTKPKKEIRNIISTLKKMDSNVQMEVTLTPLNKVESNGEMDVNETINRSDSSGESKTSKSEEIELKEISMDM
eukprot:gene8047-12509_t